MLQKGFAKNSIGVIGGGLLNVNLKNRATNNLFHIVDWYSTLLTLADNTLLLPSGIDSIDQSCIVSTCANEPRRNVCYVKVGVFVLVFFNFCVWHYFC